jgi:hypothetical protein
MKWMCGVLAWLAFLVVISGCNSDVPQAVVITRPTVAHLCHIDEPPLYPGCDCPPACPPGTTRTLVVNFADDTPIYTAGIPIILPYYTSHTDETGHIREPKPQRNSHDWDSTMTITVEYDTNGHPAPSSQVTVALRSVDSGGTGSDSIFGHHHEDTAHHKPKGHLYNSSGFTSDPLVVTTDGSGRAVIGYRADSISGPVRLIVSAPTADSVIKIFYVGVPYLIPVTGAHLNLIGATAAHPEAHFALAKFVVALNQVADKYAAFGANLDVNDMSLRFGGSLDLDKHWATDSISHMEHRLGGSADIDHLSDTMRRMMIGWWETVPGRLHNKKEHSHLHLRLWGSN